MASRLLLLSAEVFELDLAIGLLDDQLDSLFNFGQLAATLLAEPFALLEKANGLVQRGFARFQPFDDFFAPSPFRS